MRLPVHRRPWYAVPILLALACKEPPPPPPPPVPVKVATAERRDVPIDLTVTGAVEPMQTVSVLAQVGGVLEKIAFSEGQEVQEGQVLFQLDARPYAAQLAQARAVLDRDLASLRFAIADAERYDALAAKQFVTTQQAAQAHTTVATLQATVQADSAQVDQARLSLNFATIRAPISGKAGGLLLRAGNLVRPQASPLVVINQLHPILVRFAVPSQHLPAVRAALAANAPVIATPQGGTPVEGTLAFVDNAVDTSTGGLLLKARFSNDDGALWPGQYAVVRLRLGVESGVVTVPASAVLPSQAGPQVFVVGPDGKAKVKLVQVARTVDSLAVLAKGIEAGEVVITDGQLRVRDGAAVDAGRTASSGATVPEAKR